MDGYSPDDDVPICDTDDNDPNINPEYVPTCDSAPGQDWNCDGVDDLEQCNSPIIVDVAGNGFSVTNRVNGVMFDLNGDGVAEKLPWTAQWSDDAWLALDRNASGTIDGGDELFGNYSPQPSSPSPNGFIALKVFDNPDAGGNGNGSIDPGDTIFQQLRLWRDGNHDGVSQPLELLGLAALSVRRIALDYHESQRADPWGNWFRYRAKLLDEKDRDLGRWAYDVYLGGVKPRAQGSRP